MELGNGLDEAVERPSGGVVGAQHDEVDRHEQQDDHGHGVHQQAPASEPDAASVPREVDDRRHGDRAQHQRKHTQRTAVYEGERDGEREHGGRDPQLVRAGSEPQQHGPRRASQRPGEEPPQPRGSTPRR